VKPEGKKNENAKKERKMKEGGAGYKLSGEGDLVTLFLFF